MGMCLANRCLADGQILSQYIENCCYVRCPVRVSDTSHNLPPFVLLKSSSRTYSAKETLCSTHIDTSCIHSFTRRGRKVADKAYSPHIRQESGTVKYFQLPPETVGEKTSADLICSKRIIYTRQGYIDRD
jgi:hypothetical protein